MKNFTKPENMKGNFHDRQDHQFSSPQKINNLEKASNYSLDQNETDGNNDSNANIDELHEQLGLFVEIESVFNPEQQEPKEINKTPHVSKEVYLN